MIELRFESELQASREEVWTWITSVDGISRELRPYLRMTAPTGVKSLTDVKIEPGRPIFRSRVFLFGVIPIDHSELTLLELDAGSGFVEQSPMAAMKVWRHERRIRESAEPGRVVLTDRLGFEPRWGAALVGWFIARVFKHRHGVLRARFAGQSG